VIVRAKSSLLLVGLPLLLLPVLAVLQYRWIGEVSAAERDRLESSLRVASDRFATDFDAEFSRLANAFQMRDGFPESATPINDRYQAWSEANGYARLVRSIYLSKPPSNGVTEAFRVDFATHELQPAALPGEFEVENFRERRPGTFYESGDTMLLILPIFRRQFVGPRQEELRPRRDEFRQRENRPGRGRGLERNPRPDRGEGPGFGPGPGPNATDGTMFIELDRQIILRDLIPALAEKHFSSHDSTAYRIAVATQSTQPRVLYSSGGEWKPENIAKPDASVNLFSPPRPPGPTGRGRGPGNRGLFQSSLISEPWQLLVQHRAGSLERAVEDVRRRNLAMAFGILLILSAGLITVVISSQRAHTLGKLQMEFAAGVSHELRTPLAVIRSAAYNLRSGIVRDKEGVEQYAAIVQEEARRLSDMVEEVLLYSETQSGRKKYKLEPIDLNEIIDRAITNLSPAIDFEECELTTHIDPDLPPVNADAPALTQCVQNLLSNAFKYGRTEGNALIEITAQQDSRSKEVRVTVTDHGPGIDKSDQPQLFEAFYRGRNVGSNIPGNGLGLHLVKRIMLAQEGRVTFSPAPHGGASFTLHIPAAS
jgi:signal transduction histidine kinase